MEIVLPDKHVSSEVLPFVFIVQVWRSIGNYLNFTVLLFDVLQGFFPISFDFLPYPGVRGRNTSTSTSTHPYPYIGAQTEQVRVRFSKQGAGTDGKTGKFEDLSVRRRNRYGFKKKSWCGYGKFGREVRNLQFLTYFIFKNQR